jgi:hypothetical protein
MTKLTKFRIVVNLIGIIIIVSIISSLVKKDLVLDGQLIVESDLSQKLPMISILFPEHRVEKEDKHYLIQDEPVYFTVRSPIEFDEAEVEIEFQSGDLKTIGLGVATIEEGWNFESHTLYNETLNNIDWNNISDGTNTLYQKEEKFNNIADFVKISNSIEGVGAYDFDLGENFTLPNYQANNEEMIIDDCLRGQHEFYTYIKDEALDFTFKIQDINRTDGEDPLIIFVSNPRNKKIYSKIISDDGLVSKIDPASDPRYISVYIPDLEEGVYKVEFSTNDDIFIREIKTKQQKIVFIDRLYLCDSKEYSDGFVDLSLEASQVYTNGRLIQFYTAHNAGLQTITLDSIGIGIYQKHEWIKAHSNPKLSRIYIPKNDLKISSRGIFALEKEHYFNPEIINLKDYSDIEEVNYIIARYQKPKEGDNSWLKNKIKFNLDKAKIENGNLKFMLSSPDLNKNNNFKVNSLKVKLTKNDEINKDQTYQAFWQTIIDKIKKLINNTQSNENN